MKPRKSLPWLIPITLLIDVGLTVPATRYGSAFILLWLLPGLAWAGLLAGRHRRPRAEEIAVGLGLGMGSVTVLTLLLSYIPGPLPASALLVAANLIILTLALVASRSPLPNPGFRSSDSRSAPDPCSLSILHCSLFISIAALFRLVYLGYSEFQGDEGIVMMRAARAILGDGQQLFYHQKGPVEALLPIATWTMSGTINEWQARLPFAFAGLLGVAALYLLARHWFNKRSALVAALLLAINGYFVGFGRIVQYQSPVLAATTLGLLALWHWSEGGARRWLLSGAALLAFGLLAHYDAALALPAAVYVVGRRLWAKQSQWRTWLGDVLGAGALALGILALFYVPFALHPNFAKTLGYLGKARIGTGGPLYNNLLSSLPLATFYNSTYYLIGVGCLVIVASFLSFHRLGLLLPTACLLLLILQGPIGQLGALNDVADPQVWVGPVLATLLAGILLSPRSSGASRAAWLWFGAPFLFYYFLVWDPRTHVLNAFPGAVLLAGHALDRLLHLTPTLLFQKAPFRWRTPLLQKAPFRWRTFFRRCSLFIDHWSLTLLLLAVFLLLAYHPYLMFVQHNPEIKRTWPAHQPTLYWRPDDETPLFGYFGFPYRAGWKVVGALVREGTLSGVYASNEEQEITDWYIPGAERTYCPNPEWVLIAHNVQDEVSVPRAEIETSYDLWGEVRVAGQPKLWIYHRGSTAAPPQIFDVEDHVTRFDAHTTPASAIPPPPSDYVPAGYTLGDSVPSEWPFLKSDCVPSEWPFLKSDCVRLLGYRIDTANAHPGGDVHLVIYWEALSPMETSYQVFNHLYDGTMWGQRDGTPGCGLRPTVLWEPGQIVRDEYTIPIAPATPPGDIPLLIGMYSLDDGERLPVRDPSDSIQYEGRRSDSISDAIPLTVVPVR